MNALKIQDRKESQLQSRRKKAQVQDQERVNLSLSTALFRKLEEAQRATHSANLNEVLRSAAKLFVVLLEEQKSGNDVFVIAKDGTKTKYPIFILD